MFFPPPRNNLMFRCPQVNATNPGPPQIPHNNSVQITSSTNIYSFLKILHHFPLSFSPSKPFHMPLLALSISWPLFSLILYYIYTYICIHITYKMFSLLIAHFYHTLHDYTFQSSPGGYCRCCRGYSKQWMWLACTVSCPLPPAVFTVSPHTFSLLHLLYWPVINGLLVYYFNFLGRHDKLCS